MPWIKTVFLILLGFSGLFALVAAESPSPPTSSADTSRLDREWATIQRRRPGMDVRGVFGFILTAAANNWKPEAIGDALALCESMEDRDPTSPTYGNFRWYWRDNQPNDLNAVEFSMQSASLTWLLYRDRLTPEARARLKGMLSVAFEGMRRHPVPVKYTNIFVMRLVNCALIGPAIERPDITAQARAWLGQWRAYTRSYGIHEYNSPTYYAVDLASLGALLRYTQDADFRAAAEAALRLLWTDIAANYFPPHAGVSGAHSRDYDFLTGHGGLEAQLAWAGLLPRAETRPGSTLNELTRWDPPASLIQAAQLTPRSLFQRWGEDSGQDATNYIGRYFALGSAGSSYEKQDRVLALVLEGDPRTPIVSFDLDDRNHPYGTEKVATSGGHSKPIHLVPFVASVQRGAEVLLVASFDPTRKDERWPGAYANVRSNLILPGDAELTRGESDGRVLFLRRGQAAAAIAYLLANDDQGKAVAPELIRDGLEFNAQRFSCLQAEGTPRSRIDVIVWIRATEGVDDEGFKAFQSSCLTAISAARTTVDSDRLSAQIPGLHGLLRIVVNPLTRTRLTLEGADSDLRKGVLNLNGVDEGKAILP